MRGIPAAIAIILVLDLMGCSRYEITDVGIAEYFPIYSNVALSPDGAIALYGDTHGNVVLLDIATGSIVATFFRKLTNIQVVAYSPSGRLIAAGGFDGGISVWELNPNDDTGKTELRLEEHFYQVLSLAFSPKETEIASGGYDDWSMLWDLSKSQTKWIDRPRRQGEVAQLAFSEDGNHLYAATRSGKIRIFAASSGEQIGEMNGHIGMVSDLAVLPGQRLASTGWDGTIRVWDLTKRSQILEHRPDRLMLSSLAVLGNGEVIVSTGVERTIVIWAIGSNDELGRITGFPVELHSLTEDLSNNVFYASSRQCIYGPISLNIFIRAEAIDASELKKVCPKAIGESL